MQPQRLGAVPVDYTLINDVLSLLHLLSHISILFRKFISSASNLLYTTHASHCVLLINFQYVFLWYFSLKKSDLSSTQQTYRKALCISVCMYDLISRSIPSGQEQSAVGTSATRQQTRSGQAGYQQGQNNGRYTRTL